MGETIKKKWVDWLVTAIISCVVVFISFNLTSAREDSQSLKKEIDTKAPYEYVDKQDVILQKQIDQQKTDINTRLDRIESKVESSNDKILDLWKNMKSNNK